MGGLPAPLILSLRLLVQDCLPSPVRKVLWSLQTHSPGNGGIKAPGLSGEGWVLGEAQGLAWHSPSWAEGRSELARERMPGIGWWPVCGPASGLSLALLQRAV